MAFLLLLLNVEYDKGHAQLVPVGKAICDALTNRELANLMNRVFR